LYLCGEGASLLAELIRSVVDPHAIPGQSSAPERARLADRRVSRVAGNPLDSQRSLPGWPMGYATCTPVRRSETREMYENTEEVVLGGRHPVILVGSDRVLMRPDLLALMLTVEFAGPEARWIESQRLRERGGNEQATWTHFGIPTRCAVRCLSVFGLTASRFVPRFGRIRCSGERGSNWALWPAGSFAAAYISGGARQNAPIIRPLLDLVAQVGDWSGLSDGPA